MAQIAAEELGLPLERVTVSLGDSARGPYATISAGSSTTPTWARRCAPPRPTRRARSSSSRRSASTARSAILSLRGGHDRRRGRRVVAARGGDRPARRRPDPRQGRARPEPGGHAGAHLRRPGRRGRGRRRDGRGARRAHRGDPRRRPRDQPARRAEPGRGRDHPGRSGTRSPRSACSTRRRGDVLTQTLDAYRLPTIADVPEIVAELVDVPDAHLTNLGVEGARRAADHPDRRRDRERDPRRDRRRRPLAADHARGDAAGAARGTGTAAGGRRVGRSRPEPARACDARSATAASRSRAGPSSCRCCGTASSQAETLVESATRAAARDRRRRGSAPARRSPSSRPIRQIPEALREACRLAASPQLRAMGTIGGNLLQATRCWYWRLDYPVPAARRRPLPRARGRAPRARDLRATSFCASAHPSDPAAALLALGATVAHDRARARRSPTSTACRPRTTGHDDARARRADPRARGRRRRTPART